MNEAQLIEAAKAGDINRVQALIDDGEDLEQKDNYGWTALNWAAGHGYLAIVQLLHKAGANAVNSGRDLRTPYQIALAAAQVEVASLLQQVEQDSGIGSERPVRPYCKPTQPKCSINFPVGGQRWRTTPWSICIRILASPRRCGMGRMWYLTGFRKTGEIIAGINWVFMYRPIWNLPPIIGNAGRNKATQACPELGEGHSARWRFPMVFCRNLPFSLSLKRAY